MKSTTYIFLSLGIFLFACKSEVPEKAEEASVEKQEEENDNNSCHFQDLVPANVSKDVWGKWIAETGINDQYDRSLVKITKFLAMFSGPVS